MIKDSVFFNFATAHTFCASRDGHSRLQSSSLLRMTDGVYDVIKPRGSGVENGSEPESRVSLRRCLRKQRYFYAVYNYAGKADLGKAYCNPNRKLGVTMHFSEIIKLQFGKMADIVL